MSNNPNPNPNKYNNNNLMNDLINAISGSIAGLVAAIITCPIDMVKIRLQNKSSKSSPIAVFKDIWRIAGLKGLYKGVSPTVAGYLPTWAIYFVVYDASKKYHSSPSSPLYRLSLMGLDNHAKSNAHTSVLCNVFAALQAGTVSTVATNPLWVVRTRIMTQAVVSETSTYAPYYYTSTRDALVSIWRKEGARALYKGLGPSLIGVTHVVVQFPAYEYLKEMKIDMFTGDNELPKDGVSIQHILFASTISKLIASSITYPHEVVRTRLHTQTATNPRKEASTANSDTHTTTHQEQKPKYRGTWQTFRVILSGEGWRGFYKGFSLNVLRTVPASAMTLLTFELISSNLRKMAADQ